MLHPEPSPGCASGTKGRVAVMEILEVNNEIQELILNGGSEEQMFNSARKHGFISMKEDAIIKALNHIIPYEEMNTFGTKVGAEDIINDPEDITEDSVNETIEQVEMDSITDVEDEVNERDVTDDADDDNKIV